MATWIVILVLVILVLSGVKIVPEFNRIVVFRLGKCVGARGPGVQVVLPFIERGVYVDLREGFLQIPSQKCITRDNASIDVDFLIYSKVVDPAMAVVQVVNREGATQGIATTVVRAVLGDLTLDDVLSKRESINIRLRQELDAVTERWGMKVTNVEIREIVPPPMVQEAMNRQMSAERDRRAKVTEAEGRKQSVVLVAEGERQSRVLRAEGERESIRLQAEGTANALTLVSKSAATIDARTMALQQFEALKSLGASPTTRLVLPVDLLPMARHLGEYAETALAASRGLVPVHADSVQDRDTALVPAESHEDIGAPEAHAVATVVGDGDDATESQRELATPHADAGLPKAGADPGTT